MPNRLVSGVLSAALSAAVLAAAGYRSAYADQKAQIARLQADYAAARLKAEGEFAAALAAAREQERRQAAKTQAVGLDLEQARREVVRLKRERLGEIDDVFKRDGGRADDGCLGADGLRFYKRALGYGG